MYFVTMDMGTSNTRMQLWNQENALDFKCSSFGAGDGKRKGRAWLLSSVKQLLQELLAENDLSERQLECIVASGMVSCEFGLCEVPHIAIPSDFGVLAACAVEKSIPEVSRAPFLLIPGLKKEKQGFLVDIMRGEETEVIGLLNQNCFHGECLVLLPGTHNKIIRLNRDGAIVDFSTTMSGELLQWIMTDSILSGEVLYDFVPREPDVLRGADFATHNGLNAALFRVRVMAKNGGRKDCLASFLWGAVLGQDRGLIRSMARDLPVYIGGRTSLQQVYGMLLDHDCILMSENDCKSSVMNGLFEIYRIRRRLDLRSAVLHAIEREKLIAIVRDPDPATFMPAVKALYDGGIRIFEVTFDRSRKVSVYETVQYIQALSLAFSDIVVGAGTVTSAEEVFAACDVGASFIISPDCDPDIIALTRKLGLVSIPSAYTPTEIACAVDHGADYVKLFPADGLPEGYVKAVNGPLSDAKLLAVGGVNDLNVDEFLRRGFCGVGVGGNLYDKKLIRKGAFDTLTILAEKYVSAVRKLP